MLQYGVIKRWDNKHLLGEKLGEDFGEDFW